MSINEIIVSKARVHNLKSLSVTIPKNKLVVITGPSGSGKSSLAFDTIYAEGQRRYIESLSSYARQFLGQQQPPDVESISGLSPAIAIDQKTSSRNPRSTVGTITEIFDYMRVLFARAGTLYCPDSGIEIVSHTPIQATRAILSQPEGAKVYVCSPVAFSNQGELKSLLLKFQSMGFSRAFLNEEEVQLEDIRDLKKIKDLRIVIDRLLLKTDIDKRVNDSIELAYKLSSGHAIVLINKKWHSFSEHNLSPKTNELLPELEPRLFSFNSPLGACPNCNGIGASKTFDLDLMILDENLSIPDGAITPLTKRYNFLYKMVENIAEHERIDFTLPYKKLPAKFKSILLSGSSKKYKYSFESENSIFQFSKEFPGITSWLEKKYHETNSDKVREQLEEYMQIKQCGACNGLRLNRYALSTKINDLNIMQWCSLSIGELHKLVNSTDLQGDKKIISEKLLKEIRTRLSFLVDVGLDYLNLNRAANTLSGGEGQRIRLATQIGSALSGVLYVLDEPSIGLHQRDNMKLISTLKSLRDLGNTVIVVEHDEETILESDYVVDIGPGAGVHGGEVVAQGSPSQIIKNKKSATANFLAQHEIIHRELINLSQTTTLKLTGAKANNLKNISVSIPLGGLVCVTGVSGSGKSSLIHQVLSPAIRNRLSRSSTPSNLPYSSITGTDQIKSIIELDQSPIGRTPHSNPATYTGLFDEIRKLYASTPDSQIRGYGPGRFSFNVKGGRCEECEGNGVKKIEMHFLPDVFITCGECKGTRYNKGTLSVLYRGKSISDILDMTIGEGVEFFSNHKKIGKILNTLNSVGLGYMKLGQPATTLSGGEAQRLKLSKELAKSTRGHTFYILDEPTTGLHFQDIQILLKAVDNLISQGNTVLIIEHNLDIIRNSDFIIDLGPEGGEKGGDIVAVGTPQEVAKVKKSYTGQFLTKYFKK
jgi:excinuclease ABC subunit A